jgi:serine protease Do/serine protease DegQ|tara:strand:+ start:1241 stop:2605 length:1365 start_codon:yes stop_codon:yes gene_type:complete
VRHGLKLVGGLLSCLFALEIAVAGLPQSLGAEALPSLAPMLETTMPSVVNIATSGTVVERSPLFKDPFFQHFFNTPEMQRERRRTGLGSGVILDAEKGYIVTNHHVIEHADDILVTLSDGRKFSAQIVGVDPRADLAVIQIKAKKLSAIPLADSSKLRVGDFVVAIGNPFGLGQTVTSGIVSALGRSGLGIEDYEDFIQTDASINPGNSGGALVNLRGELIGINTAIVGPNGGSVGIGFAIAINMARDITAQLIEFGGVKRGYIGFRVQNISRELAQAFALEDHNGVVVTQVSKGSPAQRAGLRMGDVITGVNQVKVKDATDVRNQIGVSRVGQTLKIDLLRDNKTRRIEAEIIERSVPKRQGEDFVRQLSGAEFALIEEPRRELKGETVILLSAVDENTAAASWGLNQGDIIRAINKITVRDFEQMEAAIATSNRGMLLNIERDKRMLYILIR